MYALFRLPQLAAVSIWIGEPSIIAEVGSLPLRIDLDAGGKARIKQSVQVINLKIQHGRLRQWEVTRLRRKERRHCLSALLRSVEGIASLTPL
jgi:hypothetical protein